MRLTPDIVEEADQKLNCLGDRELSLRGRAIPVIENLALARDSFDLIDLSDNMITVLADGFPPFPRLSSLYLAHNRIERIGRGLADSLPNLTTLILTSNRIATARDLNLDELARLRSLETLSILDNPVATTSGIRELVVKHLPSVKMFNFSKITLAERAARVATSNGGSSAGQKARRGKKRPRDSESGENGVKTFNVGQLGEDDVNKSGGHEAKRSRSKNARPRALTAEESQAVRRFIEQATDADDIVKVQEAVRLGTVRQFLAERKDK